MRRRDHLWHAFVAVATLLGALTLACQTPRRSSEMPAMGSGQGLYVGHCAACHGRTGEGNGPAAIALKIRPRDLRNELFRYVSSTDGVATPEDLIQTISTGRRYGQMPAHPHLSDTQVRALAEYVQELSRLGWVERLTENVQEDEPLDAETIQEIADMRVTAEEPLTVFHPPAEFQPDAARATELYRAACAVCHGPTGRGDGLDMPLDNQGRPIKVADLTSGRLRGGRSPDEIFKRLRCGMPGTPMPAQSNLTEEEVWQLVYHVRYLAGIPLRSKFVAASEEE